MTWLCFGVFLVVRGRDSKAREADLTESTIGQQAESEAETIWRGIASSNSQSHFLVAFAFFSQKMLLHIHVSKKLNIFSQPSLKFSKHLRPTEILMYHAHQTAHKQHPEKDDIVVGAKVGVGWGAKGWG